MHSVIRFRRECNVKQITVMLTTTFKCWFIYTIYFICAIQSNLIKGIFNREVARILSETVDGNKLPDFRDAQSLKLEKYKNGGISSLSISNFPQLISLDIVQSISLRTMPKLEHMPQLALLVITNNKIKAIFSNVFSGLNLTTLDMSYNEVRSIANHALPGPLQELTLRCNQLTFFTDLWFQRPESLMTLDLSGNQIEELEEKSFARMTHLSDINLFNNRISIIGNAAFGYTSSSLFLHLGFNNLSYISASIFAKNMRIATLRLDYNRLSFLSDELLGKLQIVSMSIQGNPWQCVCLRKIEKWIPTIDIERLNFKFNSSASIPVCVAATNFAEICVPYVDRELEQLYTNALPAVPGNLCGIESIHGFTFRYTACAFARIQHQVD